MAGGGDYTRNRRIHENKSGDTSVTGDATLTTVRKAGYSIFLQRAHAHVTTGSPGSTWTLQDSAGKKLSGPFDAGTSGAAYTLDFGPEGVQLTEATDLKIDVSGAATGILVWEAYQRQTKTLEMSAT